MSDIVKKVSTFWRDNEWKIKHAGTYKFWFDGHGHDEPTWSPGEPPRGSYVYFVDYQGVLIYVGLTRNPANRFVEKHHAVEEWQMRTGMPYGWKVKASLLGLEKFDDILGFYIPTLEIAESLMIDITKGGEQTALSNLVLSEKLIVSSNLK